MIEIELRFEVLDKASLTFFSEDLEHLSTQRSIDEYYDTSPITLTKRGIYLRIRNQQTLDIKFNRECLANPDLPLQAYCEEHSFQLPLQETDLASFNQLMIELDLLPITAHNSTLFMNKNNFILHRTVDKMRASYKKGDYTITIDEVAHLGTFLEIEYMAENTNFVDMIKEEMMQHLMPLSLKPLKTGYDTLILRKQNFEEYLQSRFVLEEDLKRPL